jgi:CBS domain-containing protein
MAARDIMTASVVTVAPDTTLDELTQLLAQSTFSGVPVIDYLGRVVGIVTEADLLMSRPGQHTVESVMTKDVVAVSVDESLQEIAFLLSIRRINRVPVLEDGKLVGIISRADVVKALASKLTSTRTPSAESSP